MIYKIMGAHPVYSSSAVFLYYDACGTLAGAVLAGAAIGAGISLGTQAFSGELNWGQFALDTGVGAITGLISGSGVSRGVAMVYQL